ncbi:hypothetical protein ZHAS_00015224 [Anopheles sinensis]|uniref:Uncharacterized protein n=1 Tax=Anopheles sinensis TaxID=74873 RepID=A0A084WAF7_ANOSI|nr:hypothetical protein ZHAS_00015224 [Anopheles sinensis]
MSSKWFLRVGVGSRKRKGSGREAEGLDFVSRWKRNGKQCEPKLPVLPVPYATIRTLVIAWTPQFPGRGHCCDTDALSSDSPGKPN